MIKNMHTVISFSKVDSKFYKSEANRVIMSKPTKSESKSPNAVAQNQIEHTNIWFNIEGLKIKIDSRNHQSKHCI